jgi:cytochrome c oxidase subunit 2
MNVRSFGKRMVSSVLASAMCLGLGSLGAMAQSFGHAEPNQIGFQGAVTSVAEDIHSLHFLVMIIITVITLFVLGLLIYVIVNFNERAHPTPSRTTHHTGLEVAWTVLPVLILVIMAIPSFRLLTKQLTIPKADITLKAVGKQWAWSYEYPKDQGEFDFISTMKQDKELAPGDLRLLAVDNEAVVPVNKIIAMQITADPTGVIHSFVIPSFGIRVDAVPGRLNETWFKAEREGVYYGQCSKICGKDHAFMPIVFRVVSEDAYKAWLVDAKKKYASAPLPRNEFAANDASANR